MKKPEVVKLNETYLLLSAVTVIGPIISEKANHFMFNVIISGFRVNFEFDSRDLAEVSRTYLVSRWKENHTDNFAEELEEIEDSELEIKPKSGDNSPESDILIEIYEGSEI